jgi:hypothetical protein
MTSIEDDLKSDDANSASMASTAEPELGTAQPQLVLFFCLETNTRPGQDLNKMLAQTETRLPERLTDGRV